MPTDPLREAALAATPGPREHSLTGDCWCCPVIEHIPSASHRPAAERAAMYRQLWLDVMGRLAPLLELFDLAEDATTGDILAAHRAMVEAPLLDENALLRAALEGLANATASCPDALMAGASHDPAQANLYRWWTERASPALIEAREALRARGAGR